MARILVHGPDSVTARPVTARLVERLQQDGHEAESGVPDLDSLRGADAVIVLPGDDRCAATVAAASALDLPCLVLTEPRGPEPFQGAKTRYVAAVDEADWFAALPDWYDAVRPFAGRIVRDLIPSLVQEAGHDVAFRAPDKDDRPRLLKQKVLQEAQELLAAGRGAEQEEIGDLLEALEALIQDRAYDRETLKRVKEAKKKQRGGFARCWVVESTAPKPAPEAESPDVFEV